MHITQRVDRIAVMDRHVASFAHNENTWGWERMNSRFNEIEGVLNFTTNEAATFAAVWSWAPTPMIGNDEAHAATLFVNSQIRITDLERYNPNSVVMVNHIHNMILAVTRRDTSVALNGTISAADRQSLERAGLWLDAAGLLVTRQDVMSAFVRLYELRAGITIFTPPTQSALADTNLVTAANATAWRQAESLGFLGWTAVGRPNANLTIGELMQIMEIILRDSM
jgi:hypothetical protein